MPIGVVEGNAIHVYILKMIHTIKIYIYYTLRYAVPETQTQYCAQQASIEKYIELFKFFINITLYIIKLMKILNIL